MNALQRCEYVCLRLVRRFLFTERVANRCARWLPYYARSTSEQQPLAIVDEYVGRLRKIGVDIAGRRLLEVGAGRTNVVGCGLAAAGAEIATVLEPFVNFDPTLDAALRGAEPRLAPASADRVRRVHSFDAIASGSIDVLLSNSVLEHVRDLRGFFGDCARVLAPDGVMLHNVDYRDHFFKYPYGFLTFSVSTWTRWLDPGDLPRWRLPDHMQALAAANFLAETLDREVDAPEFARIRTQLAGRFAEPLPGMDVTRATILARRTR